MNNLVATFLILAALGLFFGYAHPTYRGDTGSSALSGKSVKELRQERQRYEDAFEKSREIELARTGLLEKYNGISAENREKMLKLLPDHIDSVRLIIDINTIAAQYGMVLKSISLIDSSEEGKGAVSRTIGPAGRPYETVGLEFSVRGSYENFRSFLRETERSLRLMDVVTLSFAAQNETAYDYKVTVGTYRLK